MSKKDTCNIGTIMEQVRAIAGTFSENKNHRNVIDITTYITEMIKSIK